MIIVSGEPRGCITEDADMKYVIFHLQCINATIRDSVQITSMKGLRYISYHVENYEYGAE